MKNKKDKSLAAPVPAGSEMPERGDSRYLQADAPVPAITVLGDTIASNALTPANVADTCACWKKSEVRKARVLLRKASIIHCLDATAHAAILSCSLDMLYSGRMVLAKIVKDYEYANTVLPTSTRTSSPKSADQPPFNTKGDFK